MSKSERIAQFLGRHEHAVKWVALPLMCLAMWGMMLTGLYALWP